MSQPMNWTIPMSKMAEINTKISSSVMDLLFLNEKMPLTKKITPQKALNINTTLKMVLPQLVALSVILCRLACST